MAFAVNLCLEELITNTFIHGLRREPGHYIQIDLMVDDSELRVQLHDDAPPFDPFSRAPVASLNMAASERPIGGLGIHLVKRLMDNVDWHSDRGGNHITLRKALSGTPAENDKH